MTRPITRKSAVVARPAGIQAMSADLYAQIRAAIQTMAVPQQRPAHA